MTCETSVGQAASNPVRPRWRHAADEQRDISTNGDVAVTSAAAQPRLAPEDDLGAYRAPLGPMAAATLRLSAIFWPVVFAGDCALTVMMGVNPLLLLGQKLMLYGLAALLTSGMALLLFRVRHLPFSWKAAACALLAVAGAPLFALIDYGTNRFCAESKAAAFDPVNFGYALLYGGAIYLGWSSLFVAMLYSFDVIDRERRLAAAREAALAAQMRALRYQVNPHFLFNTLNSIGGLIEEGAGARAERMVQSLSRFLRATLALDPMQDVPLAHELALQAEYLEIERERFIDRMVLKIDVPEEIGGALVPSLILQPLIENALKHGVGAKTGAVEILLTARRVDDRLRVSIENDMPAEDEAVAQPGAGIGQRNVAARIKARFQDAASFDAGCAGAGRYRASLDLPLRFA